ncbi:MAG: hypothetical protein CVU46_11175 [Chloroflexi bacterium HGW-Chloroflexi-8]|nr:MAG: hypothetical protein CVU46_11175 [Chloroflexi bacterium HGW-Chloroflexi-8]
MFISRQQIAAICRDYANTVNSKPSPENKRRKVSHFVHGYLLGYKHRSNIEYNDTMRLYWLRYVAPETERKAAEIELRNLEIVEPEVIIK